MEREEGKRWSSWLCQCLWGWSSLCESSYCRGSSCRSLRTFSSLSLLAQGWGCQFNELLSCTLFHWTIIFTSLERETWVNVDKNLRTWHRCSLWSHCVQCVVHCALWLGVSWGENTECYELYTGNWRPAKSRTLSCCSLAGSMFQI